MLVSYKEWAEEKSKFSKKHNHNFTVETSPMDKDGIYYKWYVFEDGAIWYERMSPVEEVIIVEGISDLTGIKFTDSKVVTFLKTEFWNTEDSKSKYYYEKF